MRRMTVLLILSCDSFHLHRNVSMIFPCLPSYFLYHASENDDDSDDADDDLHPPVLILLIFASFVPEAWVGFTAVSVACITSGRCLGLALLFSCSFSTAR